MFNEDRVGEEMMRGCIIKYIILVVQSPREHKLQLIIRRKERDSDWLKN